MSPLLRFYVLIMLGITVMLLVLIGIAHVVAPSSSVLSYMGADGYIYLMDIEHGQSFNLSNQINTTFPTSISGLTWSPNSRFAVIEAGTEGDYVFDFETYERSPLAYRGNHYFAWSPDGRYVVLVGNDFELSVFDAETEEFWIFPHPIELNPVWSSDSTQLALVLTIDDQTDIYIADIFDESFRNLTNTPAIEFLRDWSPDSNWLLFTVRDSRQDNMSIYIQNVSTNERRQVSTQGGTY